MGDLTRNLSLWEFACHCGCGLNAIPQLLADAGQQLRDRINILYASNDDIPRNAAGEIPLHIICGRRCEKHNRHIARAKVASRHVMPGDAMDVLVHGLTSAQLYEAAEDVTAFRTAGGLGVYPEYGTLHADVRGYPARWGWIDSQGYVKIKPALAWPQKVA